MATNHNIIYIGESRDGLIKIGMTQQTPYRRCCGTDYTIRYFCDAGKNACTRQQLFEAERLLRLMMNGKFPHKASTDYYYGDMLQAIGLFYIAMPHIENATGIKFGEVKENCPWCDVLGLLDELEEE